MYNKIIFLISILTCLNFTTITEPTPLYPKSQSNPNNIEEKLEWNIKNEFPSVTVKNPSKETPAIIRILKYSWHIKEGEHKGVYEDQVATIFDTAKRNKPIKVKPKGVLVIDESKNIKSIKAEYLEGEFRPLVVKKNKIIIPDKVGKFPLKLTLTYEEGYIEYGILIQSQR